MIKKTNKIFPQFKKDLKDFLTEEEGKITEKSAVKLGLSLIAAAGLLSGVMKPDDVQASCNHGSHGSHSSHGSHGSHGSHCSGGWCD